MPLLVLGLSGIYYSSAWYEGDGLRVYLDKFELSCSKVELSSPAEMLLASLALAVRSPDLEVRCLRRFPASHRTPLETKACVQQRCSAKERNPVTVTGP